MCHVHEGAVLALSLSGLPKNEGVLTYGLYWKKETQDSRKVTSKAEVVALEHHQSDGHLQPKSFSSVLHH